MGDYATIKMKNPPQSGKQLLRAVASHVGVRVSSSADTLQLQEDLEEHVVRMHLAGRPAALIIDEAQGLPPSSLEELRLLWNWERDGRRLIQIVLIGQPEFRDKLLEPRWEPLRQRIVLSYHLGHLSAADTAAYIDHRIGVAADEGCLAEFTPEAKARIHDATNGVPRLINVLCDNALLVGYARNAHRIDTEFVGIVLRDMTCWDMNAPGAQSLPAGKQKVATPS